MAAPIVPQRPARSQIPVPSANMDMPQIPSRPKRSAERSISPERDSFARSPLNDLSIGHGSSSLTKAVSRELPQRPPSVDFPSVGEEGNEYAQIQEQLNTPDVGDLAPLEQTKSVAGDLPLHAPKASLPASTAKSRIQVVTRTDSQQAAAAGIGKPVSEDHMGHTLTRTNSTQPSRPTSLYSKDFADIEEQGIPEIGVQIPLYPNAGDVQAPSPAPALFASHASTNLAPQSGRQTPLRHHTRTKSGRDVFTGPPGSYGLHGHGVNMSDPFEKDWYQKHPDDMKKEAQGEYGPAISETRKEWALTSDELNKLVHTSQLPVTGTASGVVGTPAEEIGYIASEEYASRIASPNPSSTTPPKERRGSCQVYAESPLRKMSFPAIEVDPALKAGSQTGHDHAIDSEADHEDDVIHVDPPRSMSRIEGGGDLSTEDLGSHGSITEKDGGFMAEDGYSAPILASDEVKYRPEAQFMTPAIEPEQERRDSTYLDLDSPTLPTYQSARRATTPGSRSNSIHSLPHGLRFSTHEEPLEDVKEYEPLFPDEEDEKSKPTSKSKPSPEDKPKRPELARHHFPSCDVWEDAPDSLMYQTTVKTPQQPEFSIPAAEHEPKEIFETPEQEQARKNKTEDAEKEDFIPDHAENSTKMQVVPNALTDKPVRPSMPARHKFPSRDVWEDTADQLLPTTVIVPKQEKLEESDGENAGSTKAIKSTPIIPIRPVRSKPSPIVIDSPTSYPGEKKAPTIPERPKPKVPERTSKPLQPGPADGAPLAKTTSAEEREAPQAAKPKPTVPARPTGSKIAALQAGFMKDLNQRLQLGPQAPKKEEQAKEEAEEKEKVPLADARKGRAKGPTRRKPGTSPSAAAAVDEKPKTVRFAISSTIVVFEMNDGNLKVQPADIKETKNVAEELDEPAVASNVEEVPQSKDETSTEIKPLAESKATDKASSEEAAASTAAPAPVQSSAPDLAVDATVRTDETGIKVNTNDGGESEKVATCLGDRADEPRTVHEKDEEEHVGDAN